MSQIPRVVSGGPQAVFRCVSLDSRMADRRDLLSRRQAMGLFAGLGAGVVAAACGGGSSSKGASSSASTRTTSAGASGTTGSSAACVLTPEATEGPVLPRPRQSPERHHRRQGRDAARSEDHGRGRDGMRADQGRRRRRLALRCGRCLLRLQPSRCRWSRRWFRRSAVDDRRPDVPAGHAGHRRERARSVPDHLSRLVPRPCRAHPHEGPRRRVRRAHRPAVLRRRSHRQGVRERSVQLARNAQMCATRPTTSTAARARRRRYWPSRRAARATPARSRSG